MKHLKTVGKTMILQLIREEAERYFPVEFQPLDLAQMVLVNIMRANFGDEITAQMIEKETYLAFNN